MTASLEIRRRLPEQGRIRIGRRDARGVPRSIETFRFTSHDERAIREIAARYGGDPVLWSDGPSARQWEVVTDAARIPVVLPAAPLGDGAHKSPVYERWSAAGCERRCDGCIVQVRERDAMHQRSCMCASEQEPGCKPTTHLVVILSKIPFGGGWRIKTQSWNAASELPAMVEILLATNAPCVELILREERHVRNGQTRVWNVPMLTTSASPDALLMHDVVPRGPRLNGHTNELSGPSRSLDAGSADRLESAIINLASLPGCSDRTTDEVAFALAMLVSRCRTGDVSELTTDERDAGCRISNDLVAGERRLLGFGDCGLRVTAPRRSA